MVKRPYHVTRHELLVLASMLREGWWTKDELMASLGYCQRTIENYTNWLREDGYAVEKKKFPTRYRIVPCIIDTETLLSSEPSTED